MPPFSYIGLRIIHEQKIQEALEQQRQYIGQETPEQSLLHLLQKIVRFLGRFNHRSCIDSDSFSEIKVN
jgi:hypothetical protein